MAWRFPVSEKWKVCFQSVDDALVVAAPVAAGGRGRPASARAAALLEEAMTSSATAETPSSPFPPFAPEAGAQPIPGYRLTEKIGRGWAGEVWECEAPGGLRKAIKFVPGVR